MSSQYKHFRTFFMNYYIKIYIFTKQIKFKIRGNWADVPVHTANIMSCIISCNDPSAHRETHRL